MKYYAVTDNPNELMHYGRIGMKWGQHIFGDKPKSSAYRRASKKLSRSMRNGIQRTRANWKSTATKIRNNRDARADRAFERKLKKASQYAMLAPLYEQKRAIKRNAKAEKKLNKYIDQARKGTLKYGKLTDDQVRRVTERLALERNARALGSTEKPKFKTRMKEAVREGALQGTTKGTAAMMEEVARTMARNSLNRKQRKAMDNKEKKEKQRRAQEREEKYENDIRDQLRDLRFEQTGKATLTRRERRNTKTATKSLYEIKQKQKWAEANKKVAEERRKAEQDRKKEEAALERRLREYERKLRIQNQLKGLPPGHP